MSEEANNESALVNRRIHMAERRTELALDSSLTAAYNVARGLNELLRMLDAGGGRFSEDERVKIHNAHGHAHMAFDCLNTIVEDAGNASNQKNKPD